MAIIEIHPILPGRLNDKLLDKIIRQACQAEIKEDVKLLRKYTGNWKQEDKPRWTIRSKRVAGGYESRASTSSQPFVWVETGTQRRYRAMTPGFVSKTRPNTLRTRSGRGRAAGFYTRPRPGIEARNNLATLSKMREPIFNANLRVAIAAGATRLFTD